MITQDMQLKDVNGSEKSLNVREVWDFNAPKDQWKRVSLATIADVLGVDKLTPVISDALTAAGGERVPNPFTINKVKVRGWNMPPLREASKSSGICLPADTAAVSDAEVVSDAVEAVEAVEELAPVLADGELQQETVQDALELTESDDRLKPELVELETGDAQRGFTEGEAESVADVRYSKAGFGAKPPQVNPELLAATRDMEVVSEDWLFAEAESLAAEHGISIEDVYGRGNMPLWAECRLLLEQGITPIFLYPDDGVRNAGDGKPRAKVACVPWQGKKLADAQADVDKFFDGLAYRYAWGEGHKNYNRFKNPDGSYHNEGSFDKGRCNVAKKCGDGHLIIDVDVKGGKDGRKVLKKLEELYGKLPHDTMTVKTPSGNGEGYQLHFTLPDGVAIKSAADVFIEYGAGLDLRGEGGYGLMPPSTIDGKPYTYLVSYPPKPLPDAWVKVLVEKYGQGGKAGKSPASSLPAGTAAHEGLKPIDDDDDEIRHILAQTRNAMGRVEWIKVLSVCSGYEGGEELARDWSQGGEYAKQYNDGDFDAAWNEVHGDFNGGKPMHIGTLVNISKAYNRNATGFEPYCKQTNGSDELTNGGLAGKKVEVNKTLKDASRLALGAVPSVEVLLASIQAKAAKNSGAWLAHAVLSADDERVKAYQYKHPTTSKGEPRELLGTDGKVDWAVATWTAGMHVAGEVLILQDNRNVGAVSGLTKEDAEKVVALTHELFKRCPIAQTWAHIPTDKNTNLHNTIVKAVWNVRIQSKGEAAKSSEHSFAVPPSVAGVADVAPAFVGGGFGARPAHLGGGAVSGGAEYLTAAVGFADDVAVVEVVPPVTLVSVGSLPPKRERADKTPPLELLKDAMKAEKKGKWFTCKATREIYTLTDGGWYEHVSADDAEVDAANVKEREGINIGSMNVVKDTVRLLQKILPAVEFCTVPHLIPMRNGVLDSETRQLHPYTAMLPFNWHIPHDYTDSESCDVWKGFIRKQFGDDEGRTKTLQAFLRCMIGGAYTAKKYLEVVGTSDSGKSQLMNICIALMGAANTVTSSLHALDGSDGASRFETSNLYGKKLVVMPDQEKFLGASENFRKITGGDPIRNERKNVQAGSQFVYQGFVIITANQFMNPKNGGGAILQRRVPVLFDVSATVAEKARYPDGIGQHIIDHELAGVLNWVLAMPLSAARDQLRDPDAYTKRLNNEVEDGNNPVREWLRDNVVSCERGAETFLGDNLTHDRDVCMHRPKDVWGLYSDYCGYCRGAGNMPKNRKGFVADVTTAMKGKGVEYVKETKGANRDKWILSGLRLRTPSDE